MSAMDAIRARENAPLAEYIKAEAARHGWSLNQLTERAFGRTAKGGFKNSGYLYGLVRGKHRPGTDVLAQIASALEVPLETLTALLPAPGAIPAARRAVSLPLSPPRQRVAANPDQFNLTIDGEGRATLKLHLVGLSADKALRVMAALTSAGLLPTGTETNP